MDEFNFRKKNMHKDRGILIQEAIQILSPSWMEKSPCDCMFKAVEGICIYSLFHSTIDITDSQRQSERAPTNSEHGVRGGWPAAKMLGCGSKAKTSRPKWTTGFEVKECCCHWNPCFKSRFLMAKRNNQLLIIFIFQLFSLRTLHKEEECLFSRAIEIEFNNVHFFRCRSWL